MTDLDQLKTLLDKAKSEWDLTPEPLNCGGHPKATQILRVLPGYRAHFEAEFDAQGNILTIGQWEEM